MGYFKIACSNCDSQLVATVKDDRKRELYLACDNCGEIRFHASKYNLPYPQIDSSNEKCIEEKSN